jgi:3-dehydroquinate synthase
MGTTARELAGRVNTGAYDVIIASGSRHLWAEAVFAVAPAFHYAVISDDGVASHYAPALVEGLRRHGRTSLHTIPPGEIHKTRERWSTLSDALVSAGCGRDTTVIALGGGVVGDLAGFVAATYMRGVPVVQCPTSLLAMIDASVGGKTGVDTPAGKNLIGAFHPPAAVLVDVETIATLPMAHRRAGLAEAVKHAVIADAAYLALIDDSVTALLDANAGALFDCVMRSVEIKSAVVASDPREHGERRTLNFGHTLGHALELASRFTLLHGEAVAIGMVLEARLAERIGVAPGGTAAEIEHVLRRIGLPVARPANLDPALVLEATRGDKKARGGAVGYALPAGIGRMAGAERGWSIDVGDALVLEVLA